jgi:MYXO-CTERM domain-containing protein
MPAAISAISGGRVLFSAQDPQFGRETWLAGPDGATRLFDLEPGRASGIGGALEPGYVVHGDQLTFYGRAGSWGEELFATGAAALDDTAAECRSDRQCPEGTWCVGFVCARVEPPPSFDGAAAGCGCGASGRPQGAWSFLVLAALWAGRRRR